MSLIKNLKNVDEIHHALFNEDKAKVKIFPKIGMNGRKFKSETLEPFILNDLVKQLLFVTKYAQQPNIQKNKKITEIVFLIFEIDVLGDLALKEKNVFMRLIIRICRFIKNLSFDRTRVLVNLARDFKPQVYIIQDAKLVEQVASRISEPELPHGFAEKIQKEPIPEAVEAVKQEPVKIVIPELSSEEPKIEKPVLPVANIVQPLPVNQQVQRIPEIEIDQEVEKAKKSGNEDLCNRNLAAVIIKALENEYFDKAEQIVNLITDLGTKDFALCDISQAMTKHKMFKRSLEMAQRIDNKDIKDVALKDLSTAYADNGDYTAEIIADEINNKIEKNTMFSYISNTMLQKGQKLKDVLDVANRIDEPNIKDAALKEMVKTLEAKNELDKAVINGFYIQILYDLIETNRNVFFKFIPPG